MNSVAQNCRESNKSSQTNKYKSHTDITDNKTMTTSKKTWPQMRALAEFKVKHFEIVWVRIDNKNDNGQGVRKFYFAHCDHWFIAQWQKRGKCEEFAGNYLHRWPPPNFKRKKKHELNTSIKSNGGRAIVTDSPLIFQLIATYSRIVNTQFTLEQFF